MSTDLRKKLRVSRTTQNMTEFLDVLSVTLDEISTSDSTDEFV